MTDILEELPIFRDIFRKRDKEAKKEEDADILLIYIQNHFPMLEEMTRQLVQQINSAEILKKAVIEVIIAQTEEEARQRLCSYLPS